MSHAELRTNDFVLLADILKERSGLALSTEKTYLLQSRLTPVARDMGYEGIDELIADVRANKSEHTLSSITEAMTTNETFFFRDGSPFEAMKKFALPYLWENRPSRSLKIWCAACSSGQEPYTIAMILKDVAAVKPGWKIDINATDISNQVLEKAKAGKYSQFEVQRGLPVQYLVKYFTQDGEAWQMAQEIRDMVQFKRANLLDNLSFAGLNDVIFCRNVLIYFDKETKKRVLDRIAKQLRDDGFLFLGAAETVYGISDVFGPVAGQRGVYQKI